MDDEIDIYLFSVVSLFTLDFHISHIILTGMTGPLSQYTSYHTYDSLSFNCKYV